MIKKYLENSQNLFGYIRILLLTLVKSLIVIEGDEKNYILGLGK